MLSMKSQRSEFKFLDRGFKGVLVLIPGWATDYRIFSGLDLNYNYLLPVKFNPHDFIKSLSDELQVQGLDKICLFGWSLGGFLATEFAVDHSDSLNELILSSVRQQFPPEGLKSIALKLKQNKKAYLFKFYQECFSAKDSQGSSWFKKHLLKEYLDKMDLDDLLSGLDYLSRAVIKPKALTRIKKARVFHGEDDRIAPLEEIDWVNSGLHQVDFIRLAGVGHVSFMNKEFKNAFNRG